MEVSERRGGAPPPAFEVLDALGGMCRLVRRDGTLDGSVPLRVVQGCVPFLEGNAFGWQVVLERELVLERKLAGWSVAPAAAHREALEAAQRAALPRLRAQGFLSAGWAQAMGKGLGWGEGWGGPLWLWTGLLVRPLGGLWLRVSSSGVRRNLRFDVDARYIADGEGFTPLVLALRPADRGAIRLSGEIATLAPFAPRARFDVLPLDQAPELGEAHGAFYDQAYFAAKKGQVTRKYRKLIRPQGDDEAPDEARCQLVEAGPAEHSVVDASPFVGPAGPGAAARPAQGHLHEVRFGNLVPFGVSHDGHTVRIEPDRAALAAGAREVERRFAAAMGPEFQPAHRGALWYLTKYFTPHPPGEAHFFVKPWAFVRTPPGWSCLIDGEHGPGYDLLRGVVSTDRFHATPAVFWLYRAGATIEVPRGAPLIRVIPLPRWLLGAGFTERRFLDERVGG